MKLSCTHNLLQRSRQSAFGLLEFVVATAVMLILAAIVIPSISSLQKTPQLAGATQEIVNILRLAQSKTLASEGDSQYGVYINTTPSPAQYVLFQGSSYAARNSALDKTYVLPATVEFSTLAIGNNNQVVFDKLTGATANSGSITLRLKQDHANTKAVYIKSSGAIDAASSNTPADTRITDSRHVDFIYTRTIDTIGENLILILNGTTTQTIPINPYVVDGQFDFEGTYAVGGVNQTVRVHTLRLNNPDTKFSVYRDLRFNSVSLKIKLSGDNTGSLAEYSANGLSASATSLYVNNFIWQ